MVRFIYKFLVFYITFLVFLNLIAVTTDDSILTFPEVPDLGAISGVPILGPVVEFFSFIVVIVIKVFDILFFNFTEFLPDWLNVIVFLPIVIFGMYEVLARMFRGS